MVHLLRRDGQDLQILLGEPKAAVRNMFVPLLIAFAIVEVNQFVDTFWISGLGTSAASAISTIVPFYFTLMSAGTGLSVGATTAIAFRLGRGEQKEAGGLVSNSLLLGIAMSLLFSIILFIVLDPALSLMGADEIREECWNYFLPYILLSIPLITLSVLGGTLRGEGAARRSTIIQISAALFNMVLDPILIYSMGLGLTGAGLATGLSALAAAAIGLSWYLRGKTVIRPEGIRPDLSKMMEIVTIGGPKTVNDVINGVMMYIQRIFFIVAGGPIAVMMYNYPWRFISLFNLPGRAFENGLVPVGSAAYGQRDSEKIWTAYKYSMKLTIAVSLVATAVIFFFAEPLMSIMTYESSMHDVLPKLVWTLQVSVFLLPFMAIKGLGASLLQSMKKPKIPMYFELFWGSVRMVLYAISAYGFLGVDPFDGIIYIMVGVYSLSGIIITALAVWQFRKMRVAIDGSAEPS